MRLSPPVKSSQPRPALFSQRRSEMAERTIRIDPEGNMTFLFHDQSPLLELGDPTLVRASNVKFDNDTKKWHVFLRFPDEELKLPQPFDSRAEAIRFEIRHCEELLEKQPVVVNHMIRLGVERDAEGHEISG